MIPNKLWEAAVSLDAFLHTSNLKEKKVGIKHNHPPSPPQRSCSFQIAVIAAFFAFCWRR